MTNDQDQSQNEDHFSTIIKQKATLQLIPSTGRRRGGYSRRHGVRPARRLGGPDHARARRRGGREYHDIEYSNYRIL